MFSGLLTVGQISGSSQKSESLGSFAVAFDESVYGELISQIRAFRGSFDQVPIKYLAHRYPKSAFVLSPNLIIVDITEEKYHAELR